MTQIAYKTIDEYINIFPTEIQRILSQIRAIIRDEVPDAMEAISYGMPTFKLNGKNLVHFAAWKEHIGFYPTPSGINMFKEELSQYEMSKGAIQFPLNKPMPLKLIRAIVQQRRDENIKKYGDR